MKQQAIQEIVICMGSSCFSRGNKQLLNTIQNYLKTRDLNDSVTFRGAHCFGECENGPVIMINGDKYTKVTSAAISDMLDQYLV